MMKVFGIEFEIKEVVDAIFYLPKKIHAVTFRNKYVVVNHTYNNIVWQFKIPALKKSSAISHSDIKNINPHCRSCGCELRQDFKHQIPHTTHYVFKFTCPNCRLVHNVSEENLEAFYEDLKRRIAYSIRNKNETKFGKIK